MAITWSTTSQASTDHGVKMLVYSESGAGKTSLIATLPKPMVISAEAGLLSLQRRNIERLYGANNASVCYDIPVAQVTTLPQLWEVYQWLANPANRAREMFSSIAIDSVSEIAEVVLTNAKAGAKDPRQAYGELLEQMMKTIKLFRDLAGFHVYMSAKMEPHKDEMSGVTKYWPSMPGAKLGVQLPYLFDEVFYLGVGKLQDGKPYRYLRTALDMQYIAKDRSGFLDELERPDLTHVINKIHGA